jgi:hypothetical protein
LSALSPFDISYGKNANGLPETLSSNFTLFVISIATELLYLVKGNFEKYVSNFFISYFYAPG